VRDPASSTVVQFISTFGVWLLSERLTLSPIITVVVYAMTLAVDHGTICGRSCANSGHYSHYTPLLIAPLSI
jgi:NhaP-type Na+/H+ or K+/H+ antiporter